MSFPLENLAVSGQLHVEPVDPGEYAGLVASGRARLADAENPVLSLDRYIVFQALPHTLGLGPEVWRVLAKCHQRRNDAECGASWTSRNAWCRT